MITDADYILWCACRLRNKYAENNDLWIKLYKIGEEMNRKNSIKEEEEKEEKERKNTFEAIINYDYSGIESLIK